MFTPVDRPPRQPQVKLSKKQNFVIILVAIAYLLYKLDYGRLVENPIRELVDSWGIFIFFYLAFFVYYSYFFKSRG